MRVAIAVMNVHNRLELHTKLLLKKDACFEPAFPSLFATYNTVYLYGLYLSLASLYT